MSLLDGLVQARIDAQAVARNILQTKLINHLAKLWPRAIHSPIIDSLLQARLFIHTNYEPWSDPEIARCILNSNHLAFKSPMALSLSELRLRQYMVQYYNSSSDTLNIANMGIPDEDGNLLTKVVPNGLISVPLTYTFGDKLSVVHTNAPQLRPVPHVQDKDNIIDLHPQTYLEWILFRQWKFSACCKGMPLWSDTQQVLVCQKCKKAICLS